jgi:hypothetical protein
MAYGTVKVDNITFDNGGSDQNVTVSGLYNSLTSGITVTGTISGAVVIGSTSVSGTTVAGVTVTGTTIQGASGTFTSLTGTTIQGTTATYTTGSFTSLTGTTIQGTTATCTTGSFTSLTGTTTTGTTSSFTSGVFTTLSGATATFTSGIIASGTAAAPSLAILGDPDTGVFSPGANQLAVATNGAQQVSIDSAGKVSLTGDIEFSRTNPAAITVNDNGVIILSADSANTAVASSINMNVDGLEVADFTNAGYLRFNKTNFVNAGICNQSLDNVLSLAGGTSSFNSGLNLALSGPDRVSATGYQMRWNTTNLYQWDKTSDFHAWYTGAASERLRITSAGLVGIGISVPTAQLHVANVGTNDSFIVEDSGSDTTPFRIAAGGEVFTGSKLVVNAQETYNDGVGAVGIAQINGTGLNNSRIFSHIHWGGSPKFRHCATPSVTAGTHTISVLGGGLGAHEFFGSDGVSFIPSAAIASIVDATPSVGVVPGNLTFSTAPAGTLTERLRITSAGLVGIGTSAPTAPLTVIGANNATQAIFGGLVGTTDRGLRIATDVLSGNNDIAILDAQFSTGTLAFQTASTERMRITSTGNVGIGTNAPAGSLNVSSNTAGNPSLTYDTSNIANFDYGTIQLALGINAAAPFGAFLQARDNTNAARVISLNPSGGNVGIGVTNPGSALEINAAAATSPFIAKINTSEAARIDSSGRLLVGTSSVRNIGVGFQASTGSQLFIEQTSAGLTPATFVLNRNDSNGPRVVLGRSRGTALGSNTIVQSGDELGRFDFAGADGTDLETLAAQITAHVDGTPGANDMPGRLVFSTTADGASSPTERMRIDSSANIYFNTTAAPSTTSFGTRISTVLAHSRNTPTASVAQFFGSAGECRILGNGNVQNTNNSYGAISDINLKEKIVDASSQWDDIKALKVRNYNLKEGSTHTQIGVIAQEVELVSPGLVAEYVDENTDESIKCVNYSVLYMKAVKALQEAMERIEQLEQRLTDAGIA